MTSTRSMLPALGLAMLVPIGLWGCGDPDSTAGDGTTRAAAPAIDAADRDASLDAVDRWLQAGRTDNAESIARTLVDRLPSDRHAHAALGRVLLARSGELRELAGPRAGAAVAAESAGSLRIALELAPTNDALAIEARRSLGLALEAAGRDADAIAIYRGDLGDPVCRLYLGLALLRTQALDEATEVLTELAADRPDDPLVRAAMAESLLQQGRGDAAVEAAAEAVRLDPESWPIRVRRASILRRTGNPRAAIESLIALDAESRENRAVIEEIAAGWAALDRPERVAEVWAERARSSEEDLDAALAAAVAFQTAGRGSEAETWIGIASLAAPDDARVAEARRRIATLRAATIGPTD